MSCPHWHPDRGPHVVYVESPKITGLYTYIEGSLVHSKCLAPGLHFITLQPGALIINSYHNCHLFCRPEKGKESNKPRQQQGGQPPKSGLLKRSRMLNVSEYGDGLAPIKKSKKQTMKL